MGILLLFNNSNHMNIKTHKRVKFISFQYIAMINNAVLPKIIVYYKVLFAMNTV